jgi:hypothetical protein
MIEDAARTGLDGNEEAGEIAVPFGRKETYNP